MTMPCPPDPFLIAAFYRFADLHDHRALQPRLLALCEAHAVRGVVILAPEGINGTIAGADAGVAAVLDFLRADPRLAGIAPRLSRAPRQPFHRTKVRIKREIVTLGVPGIDAASQAGIRVAPRDWNALLDDPDVLVVDTRNDYEVALGSFAGAVDPGTGSFAELPAWAAADPRLRDPGRKVAMFCTGGIRCEKSTALLRRQGVEQVYHLDGGILAYLEAVPAAESRWRGECFVFDERVSVGHGLVPGPHQLCRACRRPLTADDLASPLHRPGIACVHCHGRSTPERRAALAERQRQMERAAREGRTHVGARLQRPDAPSSPARNAPPRGADAGGPDGASA
ncbi:MAG: rhodanese-related sulfurtransferase [Xylophilus ampelinus]